MAVMPIRVVVLETNPAPRARRGRVLSAAALLAEVSAAGVSLRLIDGGKVRAAGAVPPALLDRLRERKAELVALLRGDACRHCGAPMAWPAPVGLVFGDGTAAHHACHEKAEVA